MSDSPVGSTEVSLYYTQIKKLVDQSGKSRSQISQEIRETIDPTWSRSRLENILHRPTSVPQIETIKILALYFDVPIEWIVYGEEKFVSYDARKLPPSRKSRLKALITAIAESGNSEIFDEVEAILKRDSKKIIDDHRYKKFTNFLGFD